jgi:hypothetical protein
MWRFVAVFILVATPALAAVTPNSVVTMQAINRGQVQFLQGTDAAGTYKTIYTAGANGSRCVGLEVNNNDGTAIHLVTIQRVNGAVKFGGVALNTVLSAGFINGVPSQLIIKVPSSNPGLWFLPDDSDGNSYIQMITGDSLQATYATALTTATVINILTYCGDL